MGSPKQTLGYPSRTDAVLGLRRQGLSTGEIARKIGIDQKTVTALEHSAGRTRKQRPAEELCRTVLFPVDVLNTLSRHAAKRGIHVNSLARLIVETVVDENMVDAVLDDAEERSFQFSPQVRSAPASVKLPILTLADIAAEAKTVVLSSEYQASGTAELTLPDIAKSAKVQRTAAVSKPKPTPRPVKAKVLAAPVRAVRPAPAPIAPVVTPPARVESPKPRLAGGSGRATAEPGKLRFWVDRYMADLEGAKAFLRGRSFSVTRASERESTWCVSGYTGQFDNAQLIQLAKSKGFQAVPA